jgi:hypothetical protein
VIARQIAEERPVVVVALSLGVFELAGLIAALAVVYLIWEGAGSADGGVHRV